MNCSEYVPVACTINMWRS